MTRRFVVIIRDLDLDATYRDIAILDSCGVAGNRNITCIPGARLYGSSGLTSVRRRVPGLDDWTQWACGDGRARMIGLRSGFTAGSTP